MDKTDDLVYILLVNREAGIALSQHELKCIFQCFCRINRNDIFPVCHNILCIFVHITEDITDQTCRLSYLCFVHLVIEFETLPDPLK